VSVAQAHGGAGSAAVAGGSAGAVEAAVELLRAGGNAVDAVVAAAFATAVTEPVLSSVGGGGFVLHAAPGSAPEVLDFFVDVPGRGGTGAPGRVDTVVVDFASAGPAAGASEQIFHGGWGTVAVPGCLTGYLDAHRRWGRAPLADVVAPASHLARGGVRLGPVQRQFLVLVAGLLDLTPASAALFARAHSDGHYANPRYADLLDALGSGGLTGPHDPAYAGALLAAAHEHGGLLTVRDLDAYAPVLRAPLTVERAGAQLAINPPPSAGGSIVLGALQRLAVGDPDWAAVALAQAAAREEQRAPGQVPTGTTHVSVVDAEGRLAAVTTSNGSGSGTVLERWGVPLNNMLGEEDLHTGVPLAPGARMGSMMSPTLLTWPDGTRAALGTGGSERIRSATLGVLLRLLDGGEDLATAVAAPRVHVSGDHQVHVEPGLEPDQLVALDRAAASAGWPPVAHWPTPNVYFGGVHAVRRHPDGRVTAVGDGRRGGAAAVVHGDGSVDLVDAGG
jgi:gamma-glutamyltranspeptidase/glutathione hydrolase